MYQKRSPAAAGATMQYGQGQIGLPVNAPTNPARLKTLAFQTYARPAATAKQPMATADPIAGLEKKNRTDKIR